MLTSILSSFASFIPVQVALFFIRKCHHHVISKELLPDGREEASPGHMAEFNLHGHGVILLKWLPFAIKTEFHTLPKWGQLLSSPE